MKTSTETYMFRQPSKLVKKAPEIAPSVGTYNQLEFTIEESIKKSCKKVPRIIVLTIANPIMTTLKNAKKISPKKIALNISPNSLGPGAYEVNTNLIRSTKGNIMISKVVIQ